MKMSTKARRALEGSIDKWTAIVRGLDIDKGPYNCPLCAEFRKYRDNEVVCLGCPVQRKTKLHGCRGTPYIQFNSLDEDGIANTNGRLLRSPLRYALAELLFLRSLHPNLAAYDKASNTFGVEK